MAQDARAKSLSRGAEQSLIEAAQNGDLTAFESLMRSYMGQVRAYLALRAPTPQLIDELAQETFLIAHQKLHGFRAGDPILAWLQRIAWQLLRRELKRYALDQKNRERLVNHVSILNVAPTCERDLDGRVDRLLVCLGKVPEATRQLIDHRYRDGMSSQEIAERLGKTNEWVRVTLYRARKQLRECIENQNQSKSKPVKQ